MTCLRWVLSAVCCLAGVVASAQETRELFNGKDLTGWVAEGVKDYKDADGRTLPIWTAEDGKIVCAGRGFGFLRYAVKPFADFAWHVEYRLLPQLGRLGNSGLGIRTIAFDPLLSRETRPSLFGYEIQLLDDAGKPPSKGSTGSLYRYLAPRSNPVKAAPEWNAVDVECLGPVIRIHLNGELIQDVDQRTVPEIKNKPLQGYVCLQNHGTRAEFRNLRLREINKLPGK